MQRCGESGRLKTLKICPMMGFLGASGLRRWTQSPARMELVSLLTTNASSANSPVRKTWPLKLMPSRKILSLSVTREVTAVCTSALPSSFLIAALPGPTETEARDPERDGVDSRAERRLVSS